LRSDKLRYMKTRRWNFFRKIEKDKSILLLHKSKGYILEVKEEDIDWKAYQKTKSRRNPPL
jgi:hypothetical protein